MEGYSLEVGFHRAPLTLLRPGAIVIRFCVERIGGIRFDGEDPAGESFRLLTKRKPAFDR